MGDKHSSGNWSVGKSGSVVTDDNKDIPPGTGHDEKEYYGGYLIAESIYREVDAKLIAAAPDLLEALEFCKSVIEKQGMFDLSERMAFDKAKEAIKKATE